MLSKYIILFTIYSFLGFIWESIYCTIKSDKWQQRGFLYGPICPIYGFGAIIITTLINYVPFLNMNSEHYIIKIFIVSCIGSAILEYSTSFILEKKFHAIWWDYSKMPLNIHGRICLPCTTGFGIAGIIVPKYVIPPIVEAVDKIPNALYEPISYIIVVIISIDLTLTASALSDFAKRIDEIETSFNTYMDSFVENLKQKETFAKERISEEKEKYVDSNIKSLISKKDYLYKSSIERISNFKFDKNSEKENIAQKIKNLISKQ